MSSVGKRQVLIWPEIQRDAIERKAASMGVEIARWTEDLDTSGHGIERRADFRAIVERVAAGESGGIVVALAAALLDEHFPGDPADRLIYSAARQAGARLVTRDASIARFDRARVVW